jgi:predicted permease
MRFIENFTSMGTYRTWPGSGLWRDIRFATRRLVRNPGFTFTAVAILGVGLGANTAVFSIIDAVYLDDPPHILDPDRLVRIYAVDDRAGTPASLPYPDFAYYDENQRSFDGLMGWGHTVALTVGHSDASEPARGMFVSHDYFDVLGVRPAAGRWFFPEEDGVAAPQMAAVVSHSFWSNALSADAGAVGQTITLNGLTFVVVGVAPEGFAGPSPVEIPPDVWVPFHAVNALSPRDWEMIERPSEGGWNWVQGIGRLREGVTVDVARSDLQGLSAYLKETFPVQTNQSVALNADARFIPRDAGSFENMLTLMIVAAGAVLLAGAANVAVLLLVRGSEATRDVALSKALGASGARIVRSSLIESLVVGGLGAAVGVGLAYTASGVAASILPASFSVSFEPDLTVLAFACSLALVVAVASGLIPALRAAHVDVNSALKGAGGTGHGRSRMRNGLVVAQVAVAAMLILAAALTVRSVAAASAIPFGFDPAGRILMSTTLGNHGYTPEEGQVFIRETLDRMRALPGVRAVSTMSNIPFLSGYYSEGFRHPSEDADAPSANMGINTVSADFFAAMGIELMVGRGIDQTDVAGGIPSIVVSETTAKNLWSDQYPIGQRLYGRTGQPLWEVVGVAEDTRFRDLDRAPEFYGYTALAQDYRADVVFVVHGQAPLPLLRDSLYTVDPSVAISDSRSMEEVIGLVASYYRSPALLMNFLGAISLLLAIVGLYGVLSYTVSRERRDIGVRMALGASRERVAWEIVTRALGLVLLGLAIGGSAAWLAAPVLRSFLFGVEPRDLAVWTTALLALLLVAAAASALPARRAACLNPADALRRE